MKVLVKADWVITSSLDAIKNGYIVIKNGKVDGYFEKKPLGNFKKEISLKGVLFPPFVNAHTHLELSLTSFSVDVFSSFFDWLLWIIKERITFSKDKLEIAVKKGLEELKSFGVVYVGDISSFGISRKFMKHGVSFLEIIGKDLEIKNLPPPLSIHSVYSVSFELIKKIAKDAKDRGYKFQIHLGETVDEEKFARGEENRFETLIYPFLGRKRYEKVFTKNLVEYLKKAEALFENTIAVHCTNLSRKELDTLMKKSCGIVLCPRSNIFLQVGFPKVEHVIDYDKVTVGTDGLSSNVSLSIIEEIKAIYYRLEGNISTRKLLKLITINGAKVLGIEGYLEKPIFTFWEGVCLEDPFNLILKESTNFKVLDLSYLV
ncbi:MAG: amidohydrolase family protein [Desulfurobacteriaceae bacterium]